MGILFVDHSFHKKTKSSAFFRDELKSAGFSVRTAYIDPARPAWEDLDLSRIDRVILWQMDYLAPYFVSLGYPTIVIPMFDGSEKMPALHWMAARECRFINFSYTLHASISSFGCDSLYVKYFPVPSSEPATFDHGLDALFWQRRPDQGIHWRLVNHMIGNQISRLHIHNVPDNALPDFDIPSETDLPHLKLTSSHWFPSKQAFLDFSKQFNTYIAPRYSEGIGLAFIEAMARGCCVLATDYPTHNEYIHHGVNGFLFNPADGREIDLKNARQVATAAYRTVVEGRRNWERRDIPKMMDFIASCPKPSRSQLAFPRHAIKALVKEYTNGFRCYVNFLSSISYEIIGLSEKSPDVIEKISQKEFTGWWDIGPSGESLSLFRNKARDVNSETFLDFHERVEFFVPLSKDVSCPVLFFKARTRDPGVGDILRVYLDENLIFERDFVSEELVGCTGFVPNRHTVPACVIEVRGENGDLRPIVLSQVGIFSFEDVSSDQILALEASFKLAAPDSDLRFFVMDWSVRNHVSVRAAHVESKRQLVNVSNHVASLLIQNTSLRRLAGQSLVELLWTGRRSLGRSANTELFLSPLAESIHKIRPDVASHFDLRNPEESINFSAWYYLMGVREYGLYHLLHAEELAWLLGRTKGGVPSGTGAIFELLCRYREDLQELIADDPQNFRPIEIWARTHGVREYPGLRKIIQLGEMV